MKNCPACGSDMKTEIEPCIFCDNEGCALCRDSNGMITVISCTKKGCSWYDDEEDED